MPRLKCGICGSTELIMRNDNVLKVYQASYAALQRLLYNNSLEKPKMSLSYQLI